MIWWHYITSVGYVDTSYCDEAHGMKWNVSQNKEEATCWYLILMSLDINKIVKFWLRLSWEKVPDKSDLMCYYCFVPQFSMSMEDYDYLFKIVLIGNAGVGKTCLVRRFTQVWFLKHWNYWSKKYHVIHNLITFWLQGLFPPGQGATIGVDFMIKTVEIKGEKVKVHVDTS